MIKLNFLLCFAFKLIYFKQNFGTLLFAPPSIAYFPIIAPQSIANNFFW